MRPRPKSSLRNGVHRANAVVWDAVRTYFCTLVNAVSVFINAAIAAFIALTCNNPVGGERRREIKSLRNGVHDACGVVWGPV